MRPDNAFAEAMVTVHDRSPSGRAEASALRRAGDARPAATRAHERPRGVGLDAAYFATPTSDIPTGSALRAHSFGSGPPRQPQYLAASASRADCSSAVPSISVASPL